MLVKIFNSQKDARCITHFYSLMGRRFGSRTAQNGSVSRGSYYQCLWPDRKVALSAVAITDSMLATLLPANHSVPADSPTLSLMKTSKMPNGQQAKISIVCGPYPYTNNPEKTAEAFFEFEGLPAYHTGDGYDDWMKVSTLRWSWRLQTSLNGYLSLIRGSHSKPQ